MHYGLVAEALLLASSASTELWARTKDAYIAKQSRERPLIRVIDGILKADLSDLVQTSDLHHWQETLVLISTYSKPSDFTGLCELLGSRLENELGDRANATLCYLCSVNVNKAVKYWIDSLEASNAKLGRTDTLALHRVVERVSVLLTVAPDTTLPEGVANLFAEYAALLASQGEVEVANKYATSDGMASAVLRDRLYHSSVALQQVVQPPAFPFEVAPVGVSTNATTLSQQQQQQQQPSTSTHQPTDPFAQQQPALVSTPTAHQQPQASPWGGSQTPVDPNALPPNWTALVDPGSGRTYYANTITKETTWEKPTATPTTTTTTPGLTHQQQQPTATAATPYGQAYGGATPAPATTPGGAYSQPKPQQQQQPALTSSVSGTKPMSYYEKDGFTSSHGNPTLINKYGNMPGGVIQEPIMPGGGHSLGVVGGATPSIFQPNAAAPASSAQPLAMHAPSPVPAPAPAPAPKPTEIPPELKPLITSLEAVVQHLQNSPTLTAGDKRQLGEVTKAITALGQKLAGGEVPVDVPPKIGELLGALQARDFGAASAIQQDFASTIWDQHKEWVKGLKILIMLSKK